MNLWRHIKRKYGFDAWYYAIQFDMAVLAVGVHVQNILDDFEDKRPQEEKLHDALNPKKNKQVVSSNKIVPFEKLEVTKIPRSSIGPKPKLKGGNRG